MRNPPGWWRETMTRDQWTGGGGPSQQGAGHQRWTAAAGCGDRTGYRLSVSSMKGLLPVCIKQLGQFAGSPAWFWTLATHWVYFSQPLSVWNSLNSESPLDGHKVATAADGLRSAPGQLPDSPTLPIWSVDSYCSDTSSYTWTWLRYITSRRSSIRQ